MGDITFMCRLISGGTHQVIARPYDTLVLLRNRVAQELRILPVEVRLCHNERIFTSSDFSRTLKDLGLQGDVPDCQVVELGVLRVPRITQDVMQGTWVNSKGTRIHVHGPTANVAGLVTYELKFDTDGTMVGVGEHLRAQGLSGMDMVTFTEDTWWRIREGGNEYAVTLRTVGGAAKRVELQPSDTLAALRVRAREELEIEPTGNNDSLAVHWNDRMLPRTFDSVSLSDLGMPDGASVLVAW